MVHEITPRDLHAHVMGGSPLLLVDVREPWEHALAALPGSRLLPLGELAHRLDEIDPAPGTLVVVYCHHGVRSLTGASLLAHVGAVSLAGGIDAWSLNIDPSVPRY